MDLFLKANCKANFLPKDTQHRLLVRGYEWGRRGMGSLVLFTRPEKRSQTPRPLRPPHLTLMVGTWKLLVQPTKPGFALSQIILYS